MSKNSQTDLIRAGDGFIAALDQSGGSTPKALRLYGVEESAYGNDDEMFALIHDMRARIAQAPAFTGDKVVGAILFEKTMDSDIAGKPSATFLWEERGVVPFLKVDKGLAAEENGARVMNPRPELMRFWTRPMKKASSAPKCGPSSMRPTQRASKRLWISSLKSANRSLQKG